jgi:hypothetical protein
MCGGQGMRRVGEKPCMWVVGMQLEGKSKNGGWETGKGKKRPRADVCPSALTLSF